MEYLSPPIIDEVAQLFRSPLPRASEDIEIHIIALDDIRFELARVTVDTMRLLYEKRKQLLWPKDKDQTELDRKTKLDADTAPISRDYEFLLRLETLINARLNISLRLLI